MCVFEEGRERGVRERRCLVDGMGCFLPGRPDAAQVPESYRHSALQRGETVRRERGGGKAENK